MIIYTKDSCGYCTQAKMYMQSREVEYQEMRIGKHITREEFIKLFPNVKSLPFILDGDQQVGGYNHLLDYLP
jgi:glutaredoxin